METKIVREKPLFAYYGSKDEKIELFRDELLYAEIGDSWSCMDYDSEKDKKLVVIAEVVYISYVEEEKSGVYIHCYDEIYKHDELVAIELKTSFTMI